eukprot:6998595-Prymnesium_polylepis.2
MRHHHPPLKSLQLHVQLPQHLGRVAAAHPCRLLDPLDIGVVYLLGRRLIPALRLRLRGSDSVPGLVAAGQVLLALLRAELRATPPPLRRFCS